jgi:hypothetical protein
VARARRLKSLLEHLLYCRCASLRECVDRLSLSPKLRLVPKQRQKSAPRSIVAAKNGYAALGTSLISARRLPSVSWKWFIHSSCVGMRAMRCGSSSNFTPADSSRWDAA